MSRVLVTGATGFIGRACLAVLSSRASDVFGVARNLDRCDRYEHPRVKLLKADLLDSCELHRMLADVRPTHLLHLAWVTTPGAYWTSPENLQWVEASLSLVRKFEELGGQRLVTVGSCAEYEWGNEELFREGQSLLRPATLYGVCKHALHCVIERFAHESRISTAWGRVFFAYGPYEHPQRLVASTIRSLLAGEPTMCFAGSFQRDFLHVYDAADALVTLLLSNVEGAINIGSGKPIAIAELVQRTAQLIGRPDLVRIQTRTPTRQDPERIVADATRLRRELQWLPRYELGEGLMQTIAWHRDFV